MSRWLRIALGAVLALGLIAATGCGKTPLSELKEGQNFELGGLRYNVLITRFLNPAQVEDAGYVTGQPPAPPGKRYLATFLLVNNIGHQILGLPGRTDLKITDTTGASYQPLQSKSLYSFPYGASIGTGEQVPAPDSVAANGPTQGAMELFLVNEGVTENRPLKLHVANQGKQATVELDL